jgi:hypothetical protein
MVTTVARTKNPLPLPTLSSTLTSALSSPRSLGENSFVSHVLRRIRAFFVGEAVLFTRTFELHGNATQLPTRQPSATIIVSSLHFTIPTYPSSLSSKLFSKTRSWTSQRRSYPLSTNSSKSILRKRNCRRIALGRLSGLMEYSWSLTYSDNTSSGKYVSSSLVKSFISVYLSSQVSNLPTAMKTICEGIQAVTNFKSFVLVGGPSPSGTGNLTVYR